MTNPLGTFRRRLAATATVVLITSFGAGAVEATAGMPAAPELPATAVVEYARIDAGSAMACPIPSGSEFIDSWGASRSGGRGHEGVDMIADRGTPVVAAQSGDITFKTNRLGGNAAWLSSPTGDTFYYAHFDSFEGESRYATQGEVIGYVGSTGNAQGPHLHFETHFGGLVSNPYPATYEACVQVVVDAMNVLAAADAERAAVHGVFKVSARSTVADGSDEVAPRKLLRR